MTVKPHATFEAQAEEHAARPFDAWVLAREQGADALVDVSRRPVSSLPLKEAERAQSDWKARQAYRRRVLGLPEEPDETSPLEQFLFACRCERWRLDHLAKAGGRAGARPPGGVVLAMALESIQHGLFPAPWLQQELGARADLIWNLQRDSWSDADVFGSPPRRQGLQGQLRGIRAREILAPQWYRMALAIVFEKCRLERDVRCAEARRNAAKGIAWRDANDELAKSIDDLNTAFPPPRQPRNGDSQEPNLLALRDEEVFRRVASQVRLTSPGDAKDGKNIRKYVERYLQDEAGERPSLAEFRAIIEAWPALSIQGALEHHYGQQRMRDSLSLEPSR